jgi:hypothetical protein
MDYSNTEAPASSSIVEPAVREAMPPEWMPPIEEMMPPEHGIFEATTIEEAMPPEYASSTPKEVMPPEPRWRKVLREWRPEWGPPDPRWPDDPSPILSRVNRILDRARLKNVPADLDQWQHARAYVESPTGLWWDLEEAMSGYKALVYHRKNKARRVKKLKRLERCLSLVQSEKWPSGFPFSGPWASDCCRSVLAKVEHDWPELRGRSPINWLLGDRLPKIFKEHLKRPASATSDGPYVRFAKAFMTEFKIAKRNGKSYESSTIEDALKLVGKGRIRRKGRRVPQPRILVVPDDEPLPPF